MTRTEETLVLADAFRAAVDRMRDVGEEAYEPFEFMKRDTVKDLEEEILDAMVYLAFLYYKIGLWKGVVDARSSDSADQST
jgi:hypothetical protein